MLTGGMSLKIANVTRRNHALTLLLDSKNSNYQASQVEIRRRIRSVNSPKAHETSVFTVLLIKTNLRRAFQCIATSAANCRNDVLNNVA